MVAFVDKSVTRQGHRLAYRRYPADTDDAVLVLPAMGVPAGYYRRFADRLRHAGFDVTVADLRGTGDSRPRASRATRYGYAELIEDVPALLDALAPELTGKRLLLVGHSLGGHIGTLYLAGLHRRAVPPPLTVDALTLVACGIPHHSHYGAASLPLYGFAGMVELMAAVVGHWPGHLFGGRQSHGVVRDWAHTVQKGRLVDVDGNDSLTDLATIKLPVLAVTIEGDRHTPPATMTRLTDMLTSARLSTFHYADPAESIRLNHFKWALTGQPIVDRLRRFADTI